MSEVEIVTIYNGNNKNDNYNDSCSDGDESKLIKIFYQWVIFINLVIFWLLVILAWLKHILRKIIILQIHS